MTVVDGDRGTPTGGGAGLGLRRGAWMNTGTIAHELGHVLDAWLLEYTDRQLFRSVLCQHSPQHPWYGSQEIPHSLRLVENFAEAYKAAFHDGGYAGSHPVDLDWFREWTLKLPVTAPIWI